MNRTISWLTLAALAAGLAVGAWLATLDNDAARRSADILSALGGGWLNALRITVAPLVFALLVAAIASVADAMATGRLAARALLLFTLLLFLAATYAIGAVNGMLALWPVDPEAARAFIAGAGGGETPSAEQGGISQWIAGLVPPNIFAAAAADAILPLVVFAIAFGFAATRIESTSRAALVAFFDAAARAMVVIVHWVLLAAPVGVFALAIGVGAHAGVGAAGVIFQYIAIVSAATFGVTILASLLAILWGRVPPARFFAAAAPTQVVAATTQSSIATLPAMLEAAREGLGVPARVANFVLPLAVALFRMTSPVANLGVCFFIAALYGREPSLAQIAGAIFVAYAVSIGSVGLPGQVSFFASIAPICITLGLPVEVLGVFLAVEIIPDIFRTIGNVTADLAVTAVLGRTRSPNPLE